MRSQRNYKLTALKSSDSTKVYDRNRGYIAPFTFRIQNQIPDRDGVVMAYLLAHNAEIMSDPRMQDFLIPGYLVISAEGLGVVIKGHQILEIQGHTDFGTNALQPLFRYNGKLVTYDDLQAWGLI